MNAILSAESLTFGYEADTPLIREWSAQFDRGEVVAITGPSGRGKSTLLYLLGLMLKPTSGHVRFGTREASYYSDRERARLRASEYGFVFQDAALDPSRSVIDNVIEATLYRDVSRDDALPRANELLERFGVALRAHARPGQISGGQSQRIALCRALLGNPTVLLADEPTGNLDRPTAAVVMDAFHEAAHNGASVIVVTHDLALVNSCTRVIEL